MQDKVLIAIGVAGLVLQAIQIWQNRPRDGPPKGKHKR